jgi:hypothetical protein
MASECHSRADDLFGPNVLSCHGYHDFTLLFEQTILSAAPAAILTFFGLLKGYRLFRHWRHPPIRRNRREIGLVLAVITIWPRNQR